MYLIFDTETTGFYSKKVPFNHPSQGRVCQFAFMVLDKDFSIVVKECSLIKPEVKTWIMQKDAQDVHGITIEMCLEKGIEMKFVLDYFLHCLSNCKYLIAHNIKFDLSMLEVEAANNKYSLHDLLRVKQICTMEFTTNLLKLPPKFKGADYKWPKLIEAYRYLFNKDFDKAHDALADVTACAEVFKELVKMNIVKLSLA